MSLVPDYSSSSEEEANEGTLLGKEEEINSLSQLEKINSTATCAKFPPLKQKTSKRRKPKSILYLPPKIQQLLESGVASDSDDEITSDFSSDSARLLLKRKVMNKLNLSKETSTPSKELPFLPPPSRLITPPQNNSFSESIISNKDLNQDIKSITTTSQGIMQDYTSIGEPTDYTANESNQQGNTTYYHNNDLHTVKSSKRAHLHDREMERMLQQGNFADIPESNIINVQGPAPSAWQPPQQMTDTVNSQDVRVTASFWNTQTGQRTATIKPSRLQRQKHQLNQLAFDAKLRESELIEHRGTAMKTKAETQAKYGW